MRASSPPGIDLALAGTNRRTFVRRLAGTAMAGVLANTAAARALASMRHARLRDKVAALPGVKIYTSPHPELSCALLGFSLGTMNNQAIVDTMLARHHTWIRTIAYDLNAVRISTHHYNTEQQVDRCIEGLQDIVKNGVITKPATTSASGMYADDEYSG